MNWSQRLAQYFVATLLLSPAAYGTDCDVDADGDIDRDDVRLIALARNTPANGPDDPRDPNGDGIITANDARICSLQCTLPRCAIPPSNAAPVSDAGPDQSVFVGETVSLDGSGSTDADGDPLTFYWQLISVPTSSVASLSDPTAVMPTFVADAPGSYEVNLVVNDGTTDAAPDTVIITTENSRPVADAGPDQPALVGDTVTLDGSGSTDVDGDPLTYSWSLDAPAGSGAKLSDPTEVMPTLTVDLVGAYVGELVVNDGTAMSDPDTVTITTDNSIPVANAGPDQAAFVTETVFLNGSSSFDADGHPLTFYWTLTTLPAGSAAILVNEVTMTPSFTLDVFGTYVAQLIVNDGYADSVPDTITITTLNTRPVADAGPDQVVFEGDTVQLDGSGSFDVDGDPLSFSWSMSAAPIGSTASIGDPVTIKPTFVADEVGLFVIQLIVNDGSINSDPDTTNVTVEVVEPVDTDGDGLTDETEIALGTDPNNPDTDNDGLDDGEEVNVYDTDPLNEDSDGDTLLDGEEVDAYGSNPLSGDTDGDTFGDAEEVAANSDLNNGTNTPAGDLPPDPATVAAGRLPIVVADRWQACV